MSLINYLIHYCLFSVCQFAIGMKGDIAYDLSISHIKVVLLGSGGYECRVK